MVWVLTGNLLNSRSAQLNALQGANKIDEIIKYIIDVNDDSLDIIGKVDLHYQKVERGDLDITLFIKIDTEIESLKDSLDFFMKTMDLNRIDTVVLITNIGNLYTDVPQDMSNYLKLYLYLKSRPFIDSLGVFELSPEQLQFLKENATLPKYNYIQLEYCCVPPQHLVKFCIAQDVEILSLDKFGIEDCKSLGFQSISSTMRYIMNIKSRSVCTNQGYIVKATK